MVQSVYGGIFSTHSDVKGYVPRVPEGGGVHTGRYLVQSMAGCLDCHVADEAPARADVDDVERGARMRLSPIDPADRSTLRIKVRERAAKMAASACD